MKNTRLLRLLGLLAVASLVLAACGDDSDSGDDGAAGDSGGDATEEVTISATGTEFEFAPTAWTVRAGEEFTIDFTNDGSIDHEWAIINLGDDLSSGADFEESKVFAEVEAIPAGTDATQGFTIDEAGEYQIVCALDGHFDGGMEGVLTVE